MCVNSQTRRRKPPSVRQFATQMNADKIEAQEDGMTEVRHIGPQQSIGLDNQSGAAPAVWLVELNSGEVKWEILDLVRGEYVDWKLSKIPNTREGDEYGFVIGPQGDDDSSI